MDFVTSREELRTLYREPAGRAVEKEIRRLDPHARRFIANSPFLLIGSQDAAGKADVTPKGDRRGFVKVLDDVTLAIPDRPGNNRLDTLENVIDNPAVGLLFLIPGMNETLRVNGRARVTADAALCAELAVEGRSAISAMIVTVEAVYMHCAKAFMRSGLWAPESWAPRSEMPTLGEILKDQIGFDGSASQTDNALADAYARTMW